MIRVKSLMPRSLFGRAALILVVPVVAIQLVVSMAFIQRHFEGVTRQMTAGVRIELRYLLDQINSATDMAQAQDRASALAGALDLLVALPAISPEPAADLRRIWDLSGRVVIETLRDGPAEIRRAVLDGQNGEVRLWLDTDHGVMEVAIERRRVSASNPHQLLVVMLATSVLMTVIAYLFLRNQLRPITRLAAAADAFGKGRHVPYRPGGAVEVRAAGHAFLDMRARIERQIEQRTLMLSGVSHDLRTPLTRMRLALSLMPQDDDSRALEADVAQMERMVDEFLSFSRGDAVDEIELVDPASLVAGVVATGRPPPGGPRGAGGRGGGHGPARRAAGDVAPPRRPGSGDAAPGGDRARAGEPDRQCGAPRQPRRSRRAPDRAQPALRGRG